MRCFTKLRGISFALTYTPYLERAVGSFRETPVCENRSCLRRLGRLPNGKFLENGSENKSSLPWHASYRKKSRYHLPFFFFFFFSASRVWPTPNSTVDRKPNSHTEENQRGASIENECSRSALGSCNSGSVSPNTSASRTLTQHTRVQCLTRASL